MKLLLSTPTPFDFRASAFSHGWIDLLPNAWDETTGVLLRPLQLADGRVALLQVRSAGAPEAPQIEIVVDLPGELSDAAAAEIKAAVAHMFRLDEDFSEFYAFCRLQGGRWQKAANGYGRLLRSPDLFEDIVKTICTTNVQWGGTRGMVRRLVETYGAACPANPALRAFPTPQAVAAASPEEFAAAVRMGYRAPYVHTLAQQIAAGDLDLPSLAHSGLPTADLRKRLLTLKGVGPYAAATLLMLLGRYDEIAVDSAFREFAAKKYFNGQYPGDAEATRLFDDWGRWKYLAYWFDIWEWYTNGQP